jgi:secreted PhoX family phosphatase
MPDNIAVQPNGDIIVAEDNHKYTRLVCFTPAGRWYPFAYYQYDTREELSGMAFSQDARFMIVSVYERGLTLLVTGPFRHS